MATKALQSIKFPGLADTYTIPQVDNTLTTTGAAADAKKTGDEISDLKQDFAHISNTLVTDTASGSIASFTDGADGVPMESVVVNIEPVQSGSGDPSPSNVRPITGWTSVDTTVCGVNVWDEEWERGAYDLSTGNKTTSTTVIRSTNKIPVFPSATYCFYKPNNMDVRFAYFDADENYCGNYIENASTASGYVFTTPADAHYMVFYVAGTTYANNISINYPATNTSYIAHNTDSQTVTTQLGQTVYGATLDVVSGVLTIDMGCVDLGTLNWSAYSTASSGIFRTDTSLWAERPKDGNDTPANAISDRYSVKGYNPISGSDNGYFAIGSSSGNYRLVIIDTSYSDVTAFTTAMSGVKLVYELATPQTVQLTAQEVDSLLGDNNVFADAGEVSVTYTADLKKYIQKVINA